MAQQRTAARTPLTLDSTVDRLSRVKSTEVRLLARLGVHTVRDLLLYLPKDLERFTDAEEAADGKVNFVGTILQIHRKRSRVQGMLLTEATVADDEGATLRVAWFKNPYVVQHLHPGDRVSLSGRVRTSRFGREMQSPEYERLEGEDAPSRVGELMPKYGLTKDLTSRRVATLVRQVLPLADALEDDLPDEVRARHALMPLAEAVRRGHRPESEDDFRRVRRRMDFAALLELQAAFQLGRRRVALERATPIPYRQDVIDTFKAGLAFELTRAQRRATWEVYQDMEQPVPMNRLLNGDVGSGKTAVAAAAAAMAHAAGMQTVLMAPTEILARQHRDKLRGYLEGSFPDLKVELLISGLPAAERRRVRTAAASGHCALLVGTHALIEDDVELANLGLAVVDEQHRFGTRQREVLRAKSREGRPHFLAMTATPIPRTLALALYGEMKLSIIDELPPGRTPVETQVVAPDERDAAYALVRREVRAGRQAFVICPLIEESVNIEAKAATAEFERLRRDVFPDLRMALVHGRMKDKDGAMSAFRAGEVDVLVATSVVEVGVDVPNATVMLIEGADRFGLAQLHQLRGRVGRGAQRSFCLLLSDDPSGGALHRLHLVAGTTDGFRLAEEDMRIRDVGELLGARQHGQSDFAMRALQQPELLSEVRDEAERLIAADPELERWPALWEAAARRLDQTSIS